MVAIHLLTGSVFKKDKSIQSLSSLFTLSPLFTALIEPV